MNVEALLRNKYFLSVVGIIILLIVLNKIGVLKSKDGEKLKLTESGGGIREGFNPGNEAIALYDSLKDWDFVASGRYDGYQRILDYSENELRAVHNEYIAKYKSNQYSTIRKLVNSEEGPWYTSMKNQVLQKLSKVGI